MTPIAPYVDDLSYLLPKRENLKPHDTIRMLADIARKDHDNAIRFLRLAKLMRAKIDTSEEVKKLIGGTLLGELDHAIEQAEKRA